MKQIKRHLNLSPSNCEDVTAGPVSEMIWFAQLNLKSGTFPASEIIRWVEKHGHDCPRIVIFCGRIEDCSPVYQDLVEEAGDKGRAAIEVTLPTRCLNNVDHFSSVAFKSTSYGLISHRPFRSKRVAKITNCHHYTHHTSTRDIALIQFTFRCSTL